MIGKPFRWIVPVQVQIRSGYADKSVTYQVRNILRSVSSKDFQEVSETLERATGQILSRSDSIRARDINAVKADYRKLSAGGLMEAALPLREILVGETRRFLKEQRDFASLMVLDFQEFYFERARGWALRMQDNPFHGEIDAISALLLNQELRGSYRPDLKRYIGGAGVSLIGPAPTTTPYCGPSGHLVARFEEGAKKPNEQRYTNIAFEDTVQGRAPLKFCQGFDVVFTNTSNLGNIVSHAPLMTTTEELHLGAHWPLGVPFSGTSAVLALALYGAKQIHVEGLNFYLSRQHYSQDYVGQIGFHEAHWANSAHDYLANIGYVGALSNFIALSGDSNFLSAISEDRPTLCRTYDQNFWKIAWISKHRCTES